ncbi:recombinase family protein [Campylobacter coli]|uniref:recombinase family protein n=1 Tax=Campylobacter coli TaxID=195 RepID=UPI001EDBEA84|nr:recombinase family protein [Campylobacter coli]MCG4072329.1 recombinase family protein [Campylobacter coli]
MNFAYLRISTDTQKQKNSFEMQEKAIKTKFEIDEIVKETISGSAEFSKRTALIKMLENLKTGDNVIVFRLDRLSRDLLKSGYEKELIRFRIKNTLNLKKERGEALGGKHPPFGYEFKFENGVKKLKELHQEQLLIKRIYKLRKKPIKDIVKIVNLESDRKLSYKLVQSILKRY